MTRAVGVREFFTPVVGNEVTTPRMGHFNIFPIHAGAKVVNHGQRRIRKFFLQCKDEIGADESGAAGHEQVERRIGQRHRRMGMMKRD